MIGAVSQLELIWAIADTLNGLMALPNLIGLLILSPKVAQLTRDYMKDPNSIRMKD
ncbi:alanine:cation symporter family protein [uncultured Brachyspira sp.]|uniref:alanine:cation symporter family protein n=1 Tax=uncultured Brachyspira sp. TaxID=221953 RepID=UPI00260FEF26|nr:alanine:cation symporter family protein [uncultured Brachyspira sp.]